MKMTKRLVTIASWTLGVVLWGGAWAGPKKIITQEPCGVVTVVDVAAGTTTTTTTFHLDDVTVTVPGRIAVAQDGRFAWTTAQLDAIGIMLARAGHDVEVEMPGVMLLGPESTEDVRVGESIIDGPTPFPRDRPVRPKCGKCKTGKDCTIAGKFTCCKDRTDDSCMLCRGCSVASFDPVIP